MSSLQDRVVATLRWMGGRVSDGHYGEGDDANPIAIAEDLYDALEETTREDER